MYESNQIQTTSNTQPHNTKEVSTDQRRLIYISINLLIFVVDICKNYISLTDGTRKYNYVTVNSKCDDTLNGWYRFQGAGGTKMATTCPVSMNKCDASFPAWLSEDHPTVAEGAVRRKVCIRRFGNCCDDWIFIQVKKCSSYYIYKLLYPGVCNTRYCTTD